MIVVCCLKFEFPIKVKREIHILLDLGVADPNNLVNENTIFQVSVEWVLVFLISKNLKLHYHVLFYELLVYQVCSPRRCPGHDKLLGHSMGYTQNPHHFELHKPHDLFCQF